MSDLRLLRELAEQFPPPDFDDLARISSHRRRRAAVAALAGATAGTLAIVIALSVNGVPRSTDPANVPPDPPPSNRGELWPLERIRDEGSPSAVIAPAAKASGLAARVWSVCLGADCGDNVGSSSDDEHYLGALELTLDGYRSSSLHRINGGDHPASTFIEAFDDDTVFVLDAAEPGSAEDRFRLLDASGTARQLSLLAGKAPAAPGPDVVLVFSSDLYRVDAQEATLQPLDVPTEVRMWANSVEEVLWGIADEGSSGGSKRACAVYWQQADGTFGRRQLECGTGSLSIVERLTEGRMAVEVLNREGVAVEVHVSVDGGTTWQQVRPQDAPAILSGD